ncbi:N-acetyltransferase family protein [Falsiroseomonas sp. HC035]|uniref:GNAT family N-acetyltransferase n=1 Tax=Falsiroseomonas sp. HC035 TaxID=3390999 RepID=UPI003D321044
MIRAATPEDAAAIGTMHAQAWTETYPGLVPEALFAEMTDAARRRAAWAHNLAQPLMPGGTLVAKDAGEILGFITVCAARDAALGASGEVAGLYLLRRAQGRRLGRTLLAAGAALLREAGHCSAGAWALDSNTQAQGFYAATGAVAGTRQVGWHREVAVAETAWVWADLARVTT